MEKQALIEQTNNAFDFIQKLYFETSYLIKEIEGLLSEEEEHFIIGKPGGYGITARSSNGLEPNNVNFWLLRKLAVFFVPEQSTVLKGGQMITKMEQTLKLIYIRIILDDTDIVEPIIYTGILHSFYKKNEPGKLPTKFEHVMNNINYHEDKLLANLPVINYEDAYVQFKGELLSINLYDINSSEDVSTKIIEPTLKLFRSI